MKMFLHNIGEFCSNLATPYDDTVFMHVVGLILSLPMELESPEALLLAAMIAMSKMSHLQRYDDGTLRNL